MDVITMIEKEPLKLREEVVGLLIVGFRRVIKGVSAKLSEDVSETEVIVADCCISPTLNEKWYKLDDKTEKDSCAGSI